MCGVAAKIAATSAAAGISSGTELMAGKGEECRMALGLFGTESDC